MFLRNKMDIPKFIDTGSSWEDYIHNTDVFELQVSDNKLTPELLAYGFSVLEGINLRVEQIYMNTTTYTHMSSWGPSRIKGILDFIVNADMAAKGMVCTIWGAEVFIINKVPHGIIGLSNQSNNKVVVIKLNSASLDRFELLKRKMQLKGMDHGSKGFK